VLPIEQLVQESLERALRRFDLFAGHAAAGVERDAEAHGNAVGAEMRHRLGLVVFVDEEIFLAQIRHEPSVRIGHGGGDADQLAVALEAKPIGVLWTFHRLPRLLSVNRHNRCHTHREDESLHHLASASGRSRRSTCGTMRSSVLKLTRYRPTSFTFGIVTPNGDSVPGAIVSTA